MALDGSNKRRGTVGKDGHFGKVRIVSMLYGVGKFADSLLTYCILARRRTTSHHTLAEQEYTNPLSGPRQCPKERRENCKAETKRKAQCNYIWLHNHFYIGTQDKITRVYNYRSYTKYARK